MRREDQIRAGYGGSSQTKPKIPPPVLWFSPYAWAKLNFMMNEGETEVSGMGLTLPEDPMYVVDFLVVKQECTSAHTEFDDNALADLFEEMVAEGHHPQNFGRIWIHTHPGNSPHPSSVDENTFRTRFGNCDWSVMFILARLGNFYGRVQFSAGPKAQMEISTQIDWKTSFQGSDEEAWKREYKDKVSTAWSSQTGFGQGGLYNDWMQDAYLHGDKLSRAATPGGQASSVDVSGSKAAKPTGFVPETEETPEEAEFAGLAEDKKVEEQPLVVVIEVDTL